jgi:hypothetical protein
MEPATRQLVIWKGFFPAVASTGNVRCQADAEAGVFLTVSLPFMPENVVS